MNARERIERSRTHARIALQRYRSTGRHSPDDEEAITDLISDLLHLSVAVGASPAKVAARALDHCDHERHRDPNEEV